MRQLLRSLFLLSALALPAAALPALAYADGIDDFVLTGDGHTFTFSLPATDTAYISLDPPRLSDHYGALYSNATVDGIGGYTGRGDFRFYGTQYGDVFLDFVSSDLGLIFGYNLFGDSVIEVSSTFVSYPCGDGVIGCGVHDRANVFFRLGSHDLTTLPAYPDYKPRIPFTLTITPEAPTSTTPEPATLTLLATGALGLLTSLRRRLIA